MNATSRLPVLLGVGLTVGLVATVNHLLLAGSGIPLLITPIAASSTLLFATPEGPATRPWSVIAGSTLSAAVGVTTRVLIHDPLLASVLCVVAALASMYAFRCFHPPGAAVALAAVLGNDGIIQAGYGFACFPILLNAILIVLAHRCTTVTSKFISRRRARLQGSQ